MLTAGVLIVIAGILLMVTARWAIATATAICTVALLHDAVWLGVWHLIYSDARAKPVVFHFGPMVACAIACASPFLASRSGGRRRSSAAASAGKRDLAAFGLRLIRARPPLVNRAFTRSLLW